MRLPLLYILPIFTLFLCNSNIRQQLEAAEAVVAESPDSTLTILRAIDPHDINSRADKALYSLLYSQALENSGVYVTSDSLIHVALNHYSTCDDNLRHFQSLYLHGKVMQRAKKYPDALLSYIRAEQLIDKIDTCQTMGDLYTQVGTIHHNTYDFPESIKAFQTAYEIYNHLGDSTMANKSLYYVGKNLVASQQYTAAETTLLQVKGWAEEMGNQQLYNDCIDILLQLYIHSANISEIKQLTFSPISQSISNSTTLLKIESLRYAFEGKDNRARATLERLWNNSSDAKNSVALHFHAYQIEKILGNNSRALQHFEAVAIKQDSIVRHNLQQPLVLAQRDFYQAIAEFGEHRLLTNQQFARYINAIVILIVLVILTSIYSRLLIKNMRIHRYINIANNLQRDMRGKEEHISSLSIHLDSTNNAIDNMATDIDTLFKKQFTLIDRLCKRYYETHGCPREKEAIYREVKQEIEQFCGKSSNFTELESVANRYKDNTMQILRAEVPLQESDYRLLCLLLIGFSTKTICVFTNDSVGNIYTRKSRIKQEILRHNPTNCEHIINMIFPSN